MTREPAPPDGFVRFTSGRATVVCLASAAGAVRDVLRDGSLFTYAKEHPEARELAGRGAAYAVPLPGGSERVVVRHNRHGGLLAPLTRDLFLAPTRAPYELRVSERLRARGVPTPAMVAVALYDVAAGLQRADVATREIEHSADLAAALMARDPAHRAEAIAAAADLVVALSAAGAWHADLNVKNILLRQVPGSAPKPLVLDVDRVTFHEPGLAVERNLARLLRSGQKWRARHGAAVTAEELDMLAALVRARRPGPSRAGEHPAI